MRSRDLAATTYMASSQPFPFWSQPPPRMEASGLVITQDLTSQGLMTLGGRCGGGETHDSVLGKTLHGVCGQKGFSIEQVQVFPASCHQRNNILAHRRRGGKKTQQRSQRSLTRAHIQLCLQSHSVHLDHRSSR